MTSGSLNISSEGGLNGKTQEKTATNSADLSCSSLVNTISLLLHLGLIAITVWSSYEYLEIKQATCERLKTLEKTLEATLNATVKDVDPLGDSEYMSTDQREVLQKAILKLNGKVTNRILNSEHTAGSFVLAFVTLDSPDYVRLAMS